MFWSVIQGHREIIRSADNYLQSHNRRPCFCFMCISVTPQHQNICWFGLREGELWEVPRLPQRSWIDSLFFFFFAQLCRWAQFSATPLWTWIKTRTWVCQITAFPDEAGNDLITESQYTCVWGGSREGWRAKEDKQSVKSLNHTHYWGNISGARILMYHEEHSLLNGHFTHFFIHFLHYSKINLYC